MKSIMRGVDNATPITTAKQVEALKSAGFGFVGRYLVPSGHKMLTQAEAQLLSDAGLLILTVYETTANRPQGGADNGLYDGAKAYACAQQLGMPEIGCIYFAADYDAQPADFANIEAYLRAAKSKIGGYKIGIYGSYRVVEEMHRRGVCDCYWQCVAWSGGKVSEHINAYQYAWGKQEAGIAVDYNYLYDATGLWNYRTEDDDMDVEKFKELIKEYRAELQDNDSSEYSAKAREWAQTKGLVQGSDSAKNGEPNMMWEDFMTREQLVTVLYRFATEVLGISG